MDITPIITTDITVLIENPLKPYIIGVRILTPLPKGWQEVKEKDRYKFQLITRGLKHELSEPKELKQKPVSMNSPIKSLITAMSLRTVTVTTNRSLITSLKPKEPITTPKLKLMVLAEVVLI